MSGLHLLENTTVLRLEIRLLRNLVRVKSQFKQNPPTYASTLPRHRIALEKEMHDHPWTESTKQKWQEFGHDLKIKGFKVCLLLVRRDFGINMNQHPLPFLGGITQATSRLSHGFQDDLQGFLTVLKTSTDVFRECMIFLLAMTFFMTFWQSFKINWTEVAHVAIYGDTTAATTPSMRESMHVPLGQSSKHKALLPKQKNSNMKMSVAMNTIHPNSAWKKNTMLDWRIFMLPTCPLYHNRTREQSFTILRCYVSNHGHTTTSIIQLEVP